jgi:hypothetical protein
MSENSHPDDEKALSSVLNEWKVSPSLPPRFEERVWARIAVAEARPSQGWLGQWWRAWQGGLVRPHLAAGYVTALLVVGFAAGWTRGLEKSAHLDETLSARYVKVVDPFFHTPARNQSR